MEKTKVTQEENMEHIQEREDVATNFVLEKLKNAGIEVVTDKEEFNRILDAEKLLQKMVEGGENPEKIERQRQRVNGLVVNQEPLDLSEDNIANAFRQLDRSLRFNANFEIQSEGLGEEVSVFPGSTGKHGLGIRHIIEERTKKDNLSLDETTALSALIVDAVQTGGITRDSKGQAEFTKNGIVAIVRKDYFGNEKNWILTGFSYDSSNAEKNREATEAIQTVIAKYDQSPDYSYFRSQVGAVVASLDLNISQTPIKSSGVPKIAGKNNGTEVKDNAISVTSLKTETVNKKASIRSPSDTYSLLSHVKNEEQEHFGVILLDAAHNVKAVNTVSVGTMSKSLVHPREVFSEAIKAKAAAMVVFHNHPSGNPTPSEEDLNATRALLKASEVVGIPILDHVIAAEGSYYSFLEHDMLDDLRRGAEFLIKDNQAYGFTHNGKVYLDPEVMNSNAAVHEYTHLWDKYTQNTNPELWERGKEALSKTHLWSEVKADPNYADISNDDDLILSEVHSRICGGIAGRALERIAREDGEIARDRAIDWDRETWDYLSKEFLTAEDREILFGGGPSKDQINEFVSLSLKDLTAEKKISPARSMERPKTFEEDTIQNNKEEKTVEATEKQDGKAGGGLDLECPYKNRLSEKSFSGRLVPSNNAKAIKEAIANNTAPFLPDEKGEINARPIVNANTGFCLNLKDLLPMQIKQENAVAGRGGQAVFDNARYSPIVATKKSIDASHTSIKPGERGVFFNFKRTDGTIGTSQYFFPEQTEHPEKVIQNAIEKIRVRHEGRGNEGGITTRKTLKITSSEPKEYLAKYQAAMRTNSFLECSPEIGREFVKKFSVVLDNQLAEKKDFNPKIGTLNSLLFEADKMSCSLARQMEKNGGAKNQQRHPERHRESGTSR